MIDSNADGIGYERYGVYIESDLDRQQILETAGWEFYRVKYSDWIDESFNREVIAAEIMRILDVSAGSLPS